MIKLELKEWITELACSLDRGDLKIDKLMNEVEEVVDKNITEQLTLTDVSQQREFLKKFWKYFDEESVAINCNNEEREEVITNFFNCG